jgi:type IV pilus assembly protein PilC
MAWRYVASTKSGGLKRGVSRLRGRDDVVSDLESRGLIVVTVEQVQFADLAGRLASLFGIVRHIDKVLLTKHLSLMIKAGLTLSESLRILEEQSQSLALRVILGRIAASLEAGGSFADALSAYPKVFSRFYVSIIRAGEMSGNLEQNLEHLAEQYTKEHELRAKVRTATLYPTFVLVAAALIGFFFATYVIPQVANLFVGLKGIKLPWVSLLLLDMAAFVRKHNISSFVGALLAIGALIWFLRLRMLAPFTHWIILRLPVVGPIARNVNLARFALVLGTLLRSGIPITKAIEVTADVLGNWYYRRALGRILSDVQAGRALSEGLGRESKLFPKIVVRMVNVGERTGKLEEVLGYLAEFYELEVETAMRNISNVLEPVLLALIGLLALGMAYAIIIPIYEFIGAIGRIGRGG